MPVYRRDVWNRRKPRGSHGTDRHSLKNFLRSFMAEHTDVAFLTLTPQHKKGFYIKQSSAPGQINTKIKQTCLRGDGCFTEGFCPELLTQNRKVGLVKPPGHRAG